MSANTATGAANALANQPHQHSYYVVAQQPIAAKIETGHPIITNSVLVVLACGCGDIISKTIHAD